MRGDRIFDRIGQIRYRRFKILGLKILIFAGLPRFDRVDRRPNHRPNTRERPNEHTWQKYSVTHEFHTTLSLLNALLNAIWALG